MSIQGMEGWRKAFRPWLSITRVCLGAGSIFAVIGAICLAYGRGGETRQPPIYLVEAGVVAKMTSGQTDAAKVSGEASGSDKAAIKGRFVASKSGKRYYPADCAAAKRISPANLVSFETEEAAQARGLTRAATCRF